MLEKSKKEVIEFVARTINFYKNSGREIALAEFTNPRGPFVQDEMYSFVLDLKGTMMAHGVNEKYIGKNFSDIKDSDGKSFIRDIIDSAEEKGSGTVVYKWYNPVTKETKPKSVYFEKVDDLIFCGGIYIEKWLDLISFNLQISSTNLTSV